MKNNMKSEEELHTCVQCGEVLKLCTYRIGEDEFAAFVCRRPACPNWGLMQLGNKLMGELKI